MGAVSFGSGAHWHACRVILLLASLALVSSATAEEPAASPSPKPPIAAPADVAGQVERLLVELDDPQFSVRRQAAERLQSLAGDASHASFLTQRFKQALVAESTSFEVRERLESLLRKLPAAAAAPANLQPGSQPAESERAETQPAASQPAPEAVGSLLDKLNSDAYAERDSAVRRVTAMIAHEEQIVPVWQEMKRRAADPKISASERRLLGPLIEQAHGAWLLSGIPDDQLPRPTVEQIEAWVAEVAAPEAFEQLELLSRTPAERELLDLIARDDTREQVLGILNTRLAGPAEAINVQKLQYLVDFAKPGMAAEAWNNHFNTTVQYLIIDVPQFNDAITPPRATHFDRIDDETAHCVTGNSLTEGDYPVRVAIPHPEPGRDAMFYLTNLPTPRSRLAYEYSLRRHESERLAEITKRTLDYFLKRQTALSEVEILLFAQLEPRAVSRFVGEYFAAVPNAPLVATPNGLNNQNSVYGGICTMMSRTGTREAAPALEKLARSGTLGKPVYPNRVEVAWVALLAIAARDPWPEIDPWLAGLIDETWPLTTDPDMPPEVGASAAGLLLDRHGAAVRLFGLGIAGESATDAFQFYGYRFTSPRDRQDVKRWWKKQQTIAAAKAGAAAKKGDGSQ
jgi:hypothetical protein